MIPKNIWTQETSNRFLCTYYIPFSIWRIFVNVKKHETPFVKDLGVHYEDGKNRTQNSNYTAKKEFRILISVQVSNFKNNFPFKHFKTNQKLIYLFADLIKVVLSF